jgi:hypothetical protein
VTSLELLLATAVAVAVLRILARQVVQLVAVILALQILLHREVSQILVTAAAVVAVPEAQPLMAVLVELA